MFCVVGDAWTGMSPIVTRLPSSCGGSRVFVIFSGVVASFLGLMVKSISRISYGLVTSMSFSSWVFGDSLFSLLYNPVSLASPIIRPFRSVKIKIYGSPFASSFTQAMTVSGVVIASQLLLVIFFAH